MTFQNIIAVTVVVSVAAPFFGLWSVRRMKFGSRAKQAVAAELTKTGLKARAQIVALTATGMVVNDIHVRTVVRFEITPLDGSPKFDGEKKMLLDQTARPLIGDVWPCWYDRNDHATFAVGQPTGDARAQIATLDEFGITHPLAR
ncbi:hypothetical protein KSP35_08115 [Aquihabitans sp. G128]|uniref:hypothetical protein n=1 Tax=Aquihabitans sp. G128 TaxID=2849779 RepID=UPI001C22C4C2|nr:hypothetical protein [Aquihabitans sp. G128]QXC62742.1 hypothetical protein KSP35_08115 [Aquihabitans sp. G128]